MIENVIYFLSLILLVIHAWKCQSYLLCAKVIVNTWEKYVLFFRISLPESLAFSVENVCYNFSTLHYFDLNS